MCKDKKNILGVNSCNDSKPSNQKISYLNINDNPNTDFWLSVEEQWKDEDISMPFDNEESDYNSWWNLDDNY